MVALALEWRKIAHTYPNFFAFFAMHRMNSAVGVQFLDRVLGMLRAMGLEVEEAARFFRVINYFLIGAALDEISGYAKGPSSSQPLSDQAIQAHYPHLAQAAPFFAPEAFDRTFAFGLGLLLGEERVCLGKEGTIPALAVSPE